MALKYELESTDGLSEEIKGLYTESDGKYILSVEGIPDNTAPLKTALEKERKAVAEIKQGIGRWKNLGETPEEVSERIAALQEAANTKDPKVEDMLKQQNAKFDAERTSYQSKMAEIEAQRDAALASEHQAVVDASLVTALSKAGVTETGLKLLPQLHRNQVKMETGADGKRHPVIYDTDGQTPLIGNGAGAYATFDDFAAVLAKQYPDLVSSQRKSGAGGNSGAGGAGGNTITRAALRDMEPTARAKFLSNGGKLTD